MKNQDYCSVHLELSVKFLSLEYRKLDYCFRKLEIKYIRELFDIAYEIDAFKAIAVSKDKYGLSYPTYTHKLNYFHVKGLFYPFLNQPVYNDFE